MTFPTEVPGEAADSPKAMHALSARLTNDVEQATALARRLAGVSGRLMAVPPSPERPTRQPGGPVRVSEPFIPHMNDIMSNLESELSQLNSIILGLERMV